MEQARDTVVFITAVVCMSVGGMIAINVRSPLALGITVIVTIAVMVTILGISELVIRATSDN